MFCSQQVECKMLYFTESGWTLPDMVAVSEDFDGKYNQNEYEGRIARLIRNADKHDRKESRDEYDTWCAAFRFLRREDHYISVMIRIAGLRPAGDQLRLLGAGLDLYPAGGLFSVKYNIDLSKYVPSRGILTFYIWATGVCAVIAYLLLRFIGPDQCSGLVGFRHGAELRRTDLGHLQPGHRAGRAHPSGRKGISGRVRQQHHPHRA